MSTTTPLPLAGKSALVTGAARSIGAESALTLARRGAKVVVHYRSRDTEANQTVDAIREMGAEAVAIGGDLTNRRLRGEVESCTAAGAVIAAQTSS